MRANVSYALLFFGQYLSEYSTLVAELRYCWVRASKLSSLRTPLENSRSSTYTLQRRSVQFTDQITASVAIGSLHCLHLVVPSTSSRLLHHISTYTPSSSPSSSSSPSHPTCTHLATGSIIGPTIHFASLICSSLVVGSCPAGCPASSHCVMLIPLPQTQRASKEGGVEKEGSQQKRVGGSLGVDVLVGEVVLSGMQVS